MFEKLDRFRINTTGITNTEITKVYFQIKLTDFHRDFLRYLWFDDAFKEFSDIIKFRSCRVTLVVL